MTRRSAPPQPEAALVATLQAAAEALQGGRIGPAQALLRPAVEAHPRAASARHLFGVALKRGGDLAGAEREFRAAAGCGRHAAFHTELGVLLADRGEERQAERSLRAALALDRRHAPAAIALAELLARAGRNAEALQATTPLVADPAAAEDVLWAHAQALKALGRDAERLAIDQRAATQFPRSAVAQYNLGATLGDLGRHAEAEASVRRAMALGLDASEAWLALGRALQGRGALDDAEHAFRAALERRPDHVDAHRELAQLVWMRSEDRAAASRTLERAIGEHPAHPGLHLLKSQLLEYVGGEREAYGALAAGIAHAPASSALRVAAARAALRDDPARALAQARAAVALQPDDEAKTALCEALLASGEADEAAAVATELRRRRPLDQHLLAYEATAWRLSGDPRYPALYDYQSLVRSFTIDTPTGWNTLEDYLADLAVSLSRLHVSRGHPLGQSVRGGSQTLSDLRGSADPVVQAFFHAIDRPIRSYLAGLGKGRDPLRARNAGGYRLDGAWSVRLRPDAGRHVDHVHQKGWISSACYVALPGAVDVQAPAGWIKFGEPGVPTRPALAHEHVVRPEPGRLVLFPSYMWHGTIPFGGDTPRLTIAFDVVPARPGHAGG